MKGLLVSLVAFVAYVLMVMVVCHLVRPKKPLRVFAAVLPPVLILYGILYGLTPANCWCLPPGWMCTSRALDFSYGVVILILNGHSYLDFFYGFNGGFSMSLMLALLRAGDRGLTADDLWKKFLREDGLDKIYSWRLPRLESSGFIAIDQQTQVCRLTAKGRLMARVGIFLKRCLNLSEGG